MVQEVDVVGQIALFLFGAIFVCAFILIVYSVVMHNILYKRLDPILFRNPWFSSAELAMFSSWPLSLIKAGHYMFLLTFPTYSKKKRFIGLEQELPIELSLILASKIYICIYMLSGVVAIAFFIFIFIT